jgi:hypothetical protein
LVVEQRKTIVNLYNSGINPEIISLELDVSQEEVMRVIESETNEEERKRDAVEKLSDVPLLSKLYLDSVVNIDPRYRSRSIYNVESLESQVGI